MEISVRLDGGPETLGELGELLKRLSPPGRTRLMAAIGHRMAMTLVPQGLATNIGRWPSPSGWPRAYRAGGQGLLDTGRLRQSIAYRADADDVRVGTGVRYAKILNEGGTIRPQKKWLLLPLSPPLSRGQVRGWPRGKGGIRSAYPGSFFLGKGPEGPGIYRKSAVRTATKIASGGKRGYRRVAAPTAQYSRGASIERIAAAVKKVTIRPHRWLAWHEPWRQDVQRVVLRWIEQGKLPTGDVPASGGVLDVGQR